MPYQKPQFKHQYENYIGGEWTAPVDGEYFDKALYGFQTDRRGRWSVAL